MGGPEVLIDEEAFLHNFRILRKACGDLPMMPVIKANAYGHSAELIARICEEKIPETQNPMWVVARASEARSLRNQGLHRKILVLSEFSEEDFSVGWPARTELAIHSDGDAELVVNLPREKRKNLEAIHFNVNTGMNRLGFRIVPDLAARLCALAEKFQGAGLRVSGLMTHLARGEEDPKVFSAQQEQAFLEFVQKLKFSWPAGAGNFPEWVHMSNSSGIARHVGCERPTFSAVRPGVALWGAWATNEEPRTIALKPVAQVRAPIRQFFWTNAGEGVGYGHRFVCKRKTLIGTVPLGYADGMSRSLSRRADEPSRVGFVVEGVRVPIVGTVSMDLTMVDLTDHPRVAEWTQALEHGQMPSVQANWIGAGQSAEDIAAALGTISYEVLCAMASRLPRRRIGGAS